MEARLKSASWLAGNAFSIADIALYAYTHTADEGGLDLVAYRGIGAWLARVRSVPGHISRGE
jgi:glutathione S-transferase